MSRYLSIDTEATGLHEGCLLIQLAFIPVDAAKLEVRHDLAKETLVHCPDFETLKPTLNPWVMSHMKEVIVQANKEGIDPEKVKEWTLNYLETPEVKEFFGDKKIMILGKSLSALDIPLLNRYLGQEFFMEKFHHHTVDVTSVARSFVDAGFLPQDCTSGTKLIKFLGIGDQVKHTALSDAVDMGQCYLKMIEVGRKLSAKSESNEQGQSPTD